MRNKTFNVLSIVAVCVAVVGLTVAFAALSTNLSISGSTTLKQASWDINFGTPANLTTSAGGSFVDNPVGGAVEGEPTVVGDTVSFQAQLDEPGDYIQFTIPVDNDGSIDAILSTVTTEITGVDNDLLILTVLDESLNPLSNGSLSLVASDSETLTIKAAYDADIDPEDLPLADTNITISVTLLWEQD